MTTPTKTQKRAGGEKRGNSRDRLRSRLNLLRWWGDGETCACVYCGMTLRNADPSETVNGRAPADHVTRDRIVPSLGYVMTNLVPACFACNGDASNVTWADRWADDPEYGEQLAWHASRYRRNR